MVKQKWAIKNISPMNKWNRDNEYIPQWWKLLECYRYMMIGRCISQSQMLFILRLGFDVRYHHPKPSTQLNVSYGSTPVIVMHSCTGNDSMVKARGNRRECKLLGGEENSGVQAGCSTLWWESRGQWCRSGGLQNM